MSAYGDLRMQVSYCTNRADGPEYKQPSFAAAVLMAAKQTIKLHVRTLPARKLASNSTEMEHATVMATVFRRPATAEP